VQVRTNGRKINKTCPNCARPSLKNEHAKPFRCHSCSKTEFDYFHSTGEFKFFAQLALLNDRGKIKNLRRQVPFPVKIEGDDKPLTTYVADFVYDEPQQDGGFVRKIIDFKGDKAAIDQLFKLKKRLVERFYPGVVIDVVVAR
jgi:ribosomal protein S27AE